MNQNKAVNSKIIIYIILVNADVIYLIDANYITIPTNQSKKSRECFQQKRPLYQIWVLNQRSWHQSTVNDRVKMKVS